MPAAFTTVPDVLLALVQLGQTVLPAVHVYDGAPESETDEDEFLSVGFSRDEDDASVDGESVDAGNRTSAETYAVHCILSVATGDSGPAAVADRRARCAQLFGAYASAIRADPSLGGVLVAGARADVASFAWIYGPTQTAGTYAEVEFDIAVQASYLGMP
ncbi:hypothetical protein [Catenuloplanes atrovinosus]|uniref:Uncharacterized protein n=1 Tax=Catenuloplanes atrovinosus TaxID=137266 RepID=A0AAE3YTG6_9ACTN|nr:hypothetical protein [Catenuloplanes atrovinosus]MDR7278932.1 hypothetical protein [Catenuloplanes atrovinosus]